MLLKVCSLISYYLFMGTGLQYVHTECVLVLYITVVYYCSVVRLGAQVCVCMCLSMLLWYLDSLTSVWSKCTVCVY